MNPVGEKKLIEAINILKDVCAANEECSTCPMRNSYNECYISYRPIIEFNFADISVECSPMLLK